MSLVVNANNGENIGMRVSNYMLHGYPDFGQILIKPDTRDKDYTYDWRNNTEYSVNGTAINNICSHLSENRYFLGTSTAVAYGSNGILNLMYETPSYGVETKTFTTLPIRLGVVGKCDGGEVIGKQLFYKGYLCGELQSQSLMFLKTATIHMDLKLLHSDGTLTTVCQASGQCEQNSKAGNFVLPITVYGESQGITAQEGDMVVVDVRLYAEVRCTGSYGTGRTRMTLAFGRDGTPTNVAPGTNGSDGCTSPIQISID